MIRLHIHVGVVDLDASIAYYSALFGTEPAKRKDDYAKWMLDAPALNFAISAGHTERGIEHVGIEAENAAALAILQQRLETAGQAYEPQVNANCCYATSDKGWSEDPDGVSWELFHTFGDNDDYGEDRSTTACGCAA